MGYLTLQDNAAGLQHGLLLGSHEPLSGANGMACPAAAIAGDK